ncbi:hypothetical protein [Myxococcus xanthus]|nr:hypothetical protein [Myxococcus xanthus]
MKSADVRPSVANNAYGEWLRDVLDGLALQRPHVVPARRSQLHRHLLA